MKINKAKSVRGYQCFTKQQILDLGNPFWDDPSAPYLEFPKGWGWMLADFFLELRSLNAQTQAQINILAIKEKFGTLRITLQPPVPIVIQKIVDRYEIASQRICQICGYEGKNQHFRGFGATLCKEHEAMRFPQ